MHTTTPISVSATRTVASVWGVLAGFGGLIHGIGEVLQGSVKPEGIIVNSWTRGPIADHMGGEPGMTIVPNLLITGIVTIVLSLAVIVWAAAFVQRKRGGRILILLSVGMLLVGGGFAPPLVGVLAGWAGAGIGSPLTWWRVRLPVSLRRFLARSWPALFGVCLISSLVLFAGSLIMVTIFDYNHPDFFSNLFLFTFGLLILTVAASFARDAGMKG